MVSGAVFASVVAALAWLVWLSRDVETRIATARWAGLAALLLLPVWLALVIFYAPIEEAQARPA